MPFHPIFGVKARKGNLPRTERVLSHARSGQGPLITGTRRRDLWARRADILRGFAQTAVTRPITVPAAQRGPSIHRAPGQGWPRRNRSAACGPPGSRSAGAAL